MKENTNPNANQSKERMAWLVVFAAIGFGIAGTWIAPTGIIDGSMLMLIAQLLIFAATLMGFGAVVSKVTDLINKAKKAE